MYVDDLRRATASLGNAFTQIYGQAEAPATISTLSRSDHERGMRGDSDLLLSVGRPFSSVEVAIRGEDDAIRPTGMGEVLVRGDVVMRGYWNAPEA